MSKAKSEIDKTRRGRPRSEAARKAVLKAAKDILDEVGPTRMTIEAVAQKAGVGKPTIYRYWANAQELAMSALMDQTEEPPVSDRDTDPVASLQSLIANIVSRLNTKRGRQMALMLAGAEPDSELFKAFSNKVILEGRERGIELLEAVKANGGLDEKTDLALCIDMLLGAIFLRLLLSHETLDIGVAEKAVEIVLK